MQRPFRLLPLFVLLVLLPFAGCSDTSGRPDPAGERGPRSGRRGPGGARGGPDGDAAAAAVPVEVAPVERRTIASYIETNGALEAENEVDLVARATGPIVELLAEEGQPVERGQLLARLEQDEIRARLEISRVALEETRLAYERAKNLQRDNLISTETFEQAEAAFHSARAQFDGDQVQHAYTEIRAPFSGLIVARYVDFAQQVTANQPLFRLSDFDPLLCPIGVPEKDLPRLRKGQRAYLTVEPYPGERFTARVLRISPVIDAATGMVRVTLEVDRRNRLRPGMFARVFVETETRADALVVPKSALSLESLGDAVFIADGDVAARRDVTLGFTEGDRVEVVAGLAPGDRVVVVGQDGLTDGTPIRVLARKGAAAPDDAAATPGDAAPAPRAGSGRPAGRDGGPGRGDRGRFDPSTMTAEQLDAVKQRMRDRGISEEQIEERLQRMRERTGTE